MCNAVFRIPITFRVGLSLVLCSHARVLHRGGRGLRSGTADLGCVPLTNHGSFSTVEVGVGTPEQQLSVIADTGSDTFIVLSCECVNLGKCHPSEHCFTGSGKSSTFRGEPRPSLAHTTLAFGSGEVDVIAASDTARLGSVHASMEGALLLMVDERLDAKISLEGILGLGLPKEAGGAVPNFLQHLQVGARFSVCFDEGSAGALRLFDADAPAPGVSLGSVGEEHWAVGLGSISLRSRDDLPVSRLQLCRSQSSLPCVAIPDTGTTAIMASETNLEVLFEGLCHNWLRCLQASKQDRKPASHHFVALLEGCDEWLDSGPGLDELPELQFLLLGAEGREQQITLGGWHYVFETSADSYESLAARHFSAFTSSQASQTRRGRRVCSPAFATLDSMEQDTDAWILGSALFYKYNVHYSLESSPPAISFQETNCASCGSRTDLHSSSSRSSHSHTPRRVNGPWRTSSIDFKRPI